MKRSLQWVAVLLCMVVVNGQRAAAQQYAIGGRGGLSIFSSGGSSAGLQIGPTFDVNIGKSLFAGSDLNINTQGGTPVEWAYYIKYKIDASRPDILPYVNGGFSLWFLTGGPYFALRVGGGAYFPISKNI